MIDAALGSLAGRARAIVAADVDCSGPTLRLRSEFERADEIVAKVEVMRRFPADESVAIGDSITDVEMSLAADVVFARDWLAEHLRGRGVAFESWEDFHDIRDALQQRWEGCC
jgi:2-hydroxy-3-keto-5-methylthiopentenyl-1-phosphate phosphatase